MVSEPLNLLALTAELHAAIADPRRWPQAWAALCQWFDCTELFDRAGQAVAAGETEAISAFYRQARDCAAATTDRCNHGLSPDDGKRQACLAVAEHLDHALAAATAPARWFAGLAAVPAALFLCRADRWLVDANTAARRELEDGPWLCLDHGHLGGRGEPAASLLRLAFQRLNDGVEILMPPLVVPGTRAQIRLRRLAGHADRILLSLDAWPEKTPRTTTADDADGPPVKLTARQRELAGLLLSGATLDGAARHMGISRRTARDHLNGLFRATGTHRQQDLLLRLDRNSTR